METMNASAQWFDLVIATAFPLAFVVQLLQ
jgi:hypothetical protein